MRFLELTALTKRISEDAQEAVNHGGSALSKAASSLILGVAILFALLANLVIAVEASIFEKKESHEFSGESTN